MTCKLIVSVLLKSSLSICTVAVYYAILSVFHLKTAVHCVLECYMHGSSIQFVVFKPLRYCFKETIGFDK